MSFLSGLAAFGGGFAEEAQAVKKQQSDQALKEQMIQLREGQLQLLMQKTTQAQQGSQDLQAIVQDPAYQAAISGGTPPSDPAAALQFAPPAATGGPPGGPTGQAPAPPYAPPAASGGAAPAATAPAAISQALQQGQRPASQPPGAAGAGMPTPQPQAGQPQAQLQQMPQGQQGPLGSQPQVPPGPQGQPTFDQRFQGAPPQGVTVDSQRKPTSRQPAAQPPPPGGFQPGKLYDVASPKELAAAGGQQQGQPQQQPPPEQQQRQQAQKMAQAPEATIAEIVKRHTTNPAAFQKNFQNAMKYYQMESTRRRQDRVLGMQEKKLQRELEAGKPDEAQAQAIAKYHERPLPMYGKSGQANKATMDRVLEINPDYDERKYYGSRAGEVAAGSLPAKEEMSFITKDSGAVKSFNVLVSHLKTARGTVEALNKGVPLPMNTLRSWRNYVMTEFGMEAPTDFKGVRNVVGMELNKAIQGQAGALADRDEIRTDLNAANSMPQLMSLLNKYTELSTGQLRGLAKKYKSQSGKDDFEERFLTDETRELFLGGKGESKGGTEQLPESIRSKMKEPGTYTTTGNHHWKLYSDGHVEKLD